MSYRYNAVYRDFDDSLQKMMDEHDAEKAAEADKAAESNELDLRDLVGRDTPLEAVRKTIEAKTGKKTAAEELLERDVRARLRKLAAQQQKMIQEFLEGSS